MEMGGKHLKTVVAEMYQKNPSTTAAIMPPQNPTQFNNAMIMQELQELCQCCNENMTRVEQQQFEIQHLKQQLQEQTKNSVMRYEFDLHKDQVQQVCKEVQEQGHQQSNLDTHKQKVQAIQTKLHEFITPKTPDRNTLFLNADPSTIPPVPQTMTSTTFQHPPIPSAPPRQENSILPFGTRVTIQHEGQPQDCWIQKCHCRKDGIK